MQVVLPHRILPPEISEKALNKKNENISLAGKPAEQNILVNIPQLITAYYTGKPDPSVPGERVSFGTSGHRGSSFKNSFNENHILAITQAICFYRKEQKTDGPLYLGFDTHALSAPSYATTMEVLAANNVEVMIANGDEYTPTPVISHAILKYNKEAAKQDWRMVLSLLHHIIHRMMAALNTIRLTEALREMMLPTGLKRKPMNCCRTIFRSIKRISFDKAVKASTTHRYDYLNTYVNDLGKYH